MTEHERTIGRLEAQVARLQTDVSDMDKKLDQIVALVEQGRGAKAMFAAISAAFGGVGAMLSAWLTGIVGRG